MSVKDKALRQAISLLAAIDAQYAIIIDGQKHGDLMVAVPKADPERKRRSPAAFQWHTIYGPWLESAKAGSVFRHTVQTRDEAESLRGSISSQIARRFGPGSGMTVVDRVDGGYRVEALVIGTPSEASA